VRSNTHVSADDPLVGYRVSSSLRPGLIDKFVCWQAYPGHRDAISGLAFREGTHTLLSAGFDRAVKLWSIDDGAYMDTLYGHQVRTRDLLPVQHFL